MTYPAACRRYKKAKKALLDLIRSLKIKGINTDNLLRAVENERNIEALTRIQVWILNSSLDYDDLKIACEFWTYSYENMKKEELERKSFSG